MCVPLLCCRPLSETQLQYRCAEGDEDKTGQREKPSKGDTSQFSCVFRSGDYNILVDNPKDCFLSVQMKDFRPSSTKVCINTKYQLSSCVKGENILIQSSHCYIIYTHVCTKM